MRGLSHKLGMETRTVDEERGKQHQDTDKTVDDRKLETVDLSAEAREAIANGADVYFLDLNARSNKKPRVDKAEPVVPASDRKMQIIALIVDANLEMARANVELSKIISKLF